MGLDLSRTATKLLRKLAATSESGYIELEVKTDAEYDPDTGIQTTPPQISYVGLNGACTNYENSEVDGTRIINTDMRCVVDNLTQVSNDDVIRVGGKSATVKNLKTKNHAGIVQVYEFTARFV